MELGLYSDLWDSKEEWEIVLGHKEFRWGNKTHKIICQWEITVCSQKMRNS